MDYKIWPGIKTVRPSFGIAMAHQQVVKWAIQENLPEITIAEDDILSQQMGLLHTTCKTNLPLLIYISVE
jgi:GR25 family glycosyltransferase involved in LPS biosynthesis